MNARRRKGDPLMTWSPPFPDAVQVVIDKIVDPQTVEPRDGFSDEALFIQKKRQMFLMRNDEEYTGYPTKALFNKTISELQFAMKAATNLKRKKRKGKSNSWETVKNIRE
jgi:hypothetical protein